MLDFLEEQENTTALLTPEPTNHGTCVDSGNFCTHVFSSIPFACPFRADPLKTPSKRKNYSTFRGSLSSKNNPENISFSGRPSYDPLIWRNEPSLWAEYQQVVGVSSRCREEFEGDEIEISCRVIEVDESPELG